MNRIRALRLKRGLTQQQMAEELGLKNFQSVGFYETEKRKLTERTAYKFANYFGVSVAYLRGEEEEQPTDDSIKWLNPIPLTQKIPIYGIVSAGLPIFCEQNIEGYTYLPDIENTSDVFCLRVNGNSMNLAGIPDQSLVIVHRQSIVENGEIAVVRVNDNEALVKRFYRENNIVKLIPESSDSQFKEQDFDLMNTSVYIIGKVIGSQIRF